MNAPGLRDYSGARITRHALERFVERFGVEPLAAEGELRRVLARVRRLGRNAETGAIAAIGSYAHRAIVAVFQKEACLTVLTWNQFLPRLAEFGRKRLPRKRGRFLRRLGASLEPEPPEPEAPEPSDSG